MIKTKTLFQAEDGLGLPMYTEDGINPVLCYKYIRESLGSTPEKVSVTITDQPTQGWESIYIYQDTMLDPVWASAKLYEECKSLDGNFYGWRNLHAVARAILRELLKGEKLPKQFWVKLIPIVTL